MYVLALSFPFVQQVKLSPAGDSFIKMRFSYDHWAQWESLPVNYSSRYTGLYSQIIIETVAVTSMLSVLFWPDLTAEFFLLDLVWLTCSTTVVIYWLNTKLNGWIIVHTDQLWFDFSASYCLITLLLCFPSWYAYPSHHGNLHLSWLLWLASWNKTEWVL